LCQPTGLAAAWGPTRAQGVLVSVSPTNLGGCAGWQYSLDDGNKPVCTVSTQSLSSAPPATIDLSNCGTAPAQGWRLTVSWTDPAGTQHDSGSMTISGTPPP
jgi:hypothetical protein